MSLFPGTIENPDSHLVAAIRRGIEKCAGHCPCVPSYLHGEHTICPCKDYRTDGTCTCKLYVREDEC